MREFIWTMGLLVAGVALVGALCNALVRNALVAIPLSIGCSLALFYVTARGDPFWPIAALIVVPIIIAVSFAMGMLGRAARQAIDSEDEP